jgi:two-component system nitrogen regulation response regulator GlnG
MARLIKTDLTVMIIGASGTGKELVARALHDFGKRKEKPFIVVNLGTIPSEQVDSILFGANDKNSNVAPLGKFQLAKGGTLFIDEVGEMPLQTQAKILRVLTDKNFTKRGSKELLKLNCRIICSKFLVEEHIILQFNFINSLLPLFVKFLSVSTLNILACVCRGISPTSSINNVPPLAN